MFNLHAQSQLYKAERRSGSPLEFVVSSRQHLGPISSQGIMSLAKETTVLVTSLPREVQKVFITFFLFLFFYFLA